MSRSPRGSTRYFTDTFSIVCLVWFWSGSTEEGRLLHQGNHTGAVTGEGNGDSQTTTGLGRDESKVIFVIVRVRLHTRRNEKCAWFRVL